MEWKKLEEDKRDISAVYVKLMWNVSRQRHLSKYLKVWNINISIEKLLAKICQNHQVMTREKKAQQKNNNNKNNSKSFWLNFIFSSECFKVIAALREDK